MYAKNTTCMYVWMYVYLPPCPCSTKWSVLGCQLVNCFWIGETGPLRTRETGPLGAGKLRKQDPKGISWEPPISILLSCRVALNFFGHFFDIVLRPQFSQFWYQLAKLDPKQLFQEGSKSQPKLHLGFDAFFGSIFDRFGMPFWCQVGSS